MLRSHSGFSLLEVLVALVLLSLTAVLCVESYRRTGSLKQLSIGCRGAICTSTECQCAYGVSEGIQLFE